MGTCPSSYYYYNIHARTNQAQIQICKKTIRHFTQIIYNISMVKRTKTNALCARDEQKATAVGNLCAPFIRRILPFLTGWLILLVSVSFFTATYDSAHVKLTLFQIGSTLLLTLWTALKITEQQNPFTRRTLVFLAPLLMYIGWQTLSFLCFPYKLEAAEEFIRLLMYGAISCLIACEFTLKDVQTLTKFIIVTAWICLSYGVLQIINIWLPGADLLPWHGFFGNRIFSTHANPNFFGAFIVFASGLIGAEFLHTRKKSLLVLLALGLLDLIFTESKGAWLAYGGLWVFATFTYTNCLSRFQKHLKKTNIIAILLLLIAAGATGIYSAKRFQSVSFRAYTWLSAWEMVQDSPILGTGPGSFKLVYPAYRRPQIFYIENAHNNETQHAENEYLEQAATGGVIGLALFLWLVVFVFIGAFKNMRSCLSDDPRRYYLLGYSAALAGLLLHAFVDISIHFASSGLLLAVFIGVLLALLQQNSPARLTPVLKPTYPRILWVLRTLVWMSVAAAVIYMGVSFYYVLRNIAVKTFVEGILYTVSILTFVGCVLTVCYIYVRITRQTTRLSVCILLLVSLLPCVFFFRFLLANHYYSLGFALVQMEQAPAALGAFSDAIRLNPYLSEYRQYRANVFALTLDPAKRFVPALGDTTHPRTDFERAKADLDFVFAHNPNHALLHQDAGQLHYTLAMRQLGQAQTDPAQAFLYQQLARENFKQAKTYFTQSLRLDPVNVNTYLLLINMALLARDTKEAQAWADMYYAGPDTVTEPDFLERHKNNPHMQAAQAHIDRLKATLM